MEYIKKEELIIGEIYKSNKYNHIFKYQSINGNTNINIGCNYRHFSRGSATIGQGLDNIINTTSEEKHWLNTCIKLDKFITFEEAMKTFIPEYVECTLQQIGSDYKLGEIYKVSSTSQNVNKIESHNNQGIAFYQMNKHRFKPSTKEAYDAQFVVKEPEFVLPEKWYVKSTNENFNIIKSWSIQKSNIDYTSYINYDYVSFNYLGQYRCKRDCIEITFEQFKKYVLKEEIVVEEVIEQPITENKTELEIWLENTKSLNLSLEDLEKHIESGQTCNFDNIYMKLEGNYSKGRAKILFDKWNNKVIEPLPQFKVIETIETITKVENNEGNQFFIGDVVISSNGTIQTIESFGYNKAKTNIIAFTNKQSRLGNGIGIDKIEHYIEPKVEETLLEKAKRLYPIGTKFKSATSKRIFTIKNHIQEPCQNPNTIIFSTNEINADNKFYACVHSHIREWAEIINE